LQSGKIGMRDVAFRYRPDLPLVLKYVTVDIRQVRPYDNYQFSSAFCIKV
jgi:hypothetical protein